jgi:hypothetical protein
VSALVYGMLTAWPQKKKDMKNATVSLITVAILMFTQIAFAGVGTIF